MKTENFSNDRPDCEEVAEYVMDRVRVAADWPIAFAAAARHFNIEIWQAESMYDEVYRQHMADRGMDC